MDIQVTQGSLKESLGVLKKLPEFDRLLDSQYYSDKLINKPKLILIAKHENKCVGCKIGYEKHKDGTFYSWLGGVIPNYREEGIARILADRQEEWARKKGYKAIRFKTLNRHKAMLIFAVKNGFKIYNVKPKDELENYRIEMIKDL